MSIIETAWAWLTSNYQWVFSGIGVAILLAIIGIARKRSGSVTQKQKSGDNSTNIQARDIKVTMKPTPPDDE